MREKMGTYCFPELSKLLAGCPAPAAWLILTVSRPQPDR